MKRHLQCAEQQASPSNLTKCCPCQEKWCGSLIVVTYETSFTMRGATGITLQPHQILRLPRKIALQNQRRICRKQLRRQFQCGDDSSMIREWSDHDPSMNPSSRTRPFAEVTFRASETHFVLKITTFRASAIYPNFTEYCACHKKWHSKIPKCCACHEKWDCYWTVTELSWYWTVTELTCYWAVTELLLNCYWTELLLNCYWTGTELLLNWPVNYWAVTELLLNWAACYWTVTELSCYWTVTELSCYWTVTEMLLNWAVTELLLNWAVTELLLNCYWTELLLNCYWTELILICYWTVTELLLFLNLRNSEVSQLYFLWLYYVILSIYLYNKFVCVYILYCMNVICMVFKTTFIPAAWWCMVMAMQFPWWKWNS